MYKKLKGKMTFNRRVYIIAMALWVISILIAAAKPHIIGSISGQFGYAPQAFAMFFVVPASFYCVATAHVTKPNIMTFIFSAFIGISSIAYIMGYSPLVFAGFIENILTGII